MMTFGSHAETPPPHMLTAVRFNTLVRLNERTDDGRLIRNTGFSARNLPLSFSAMFTTMHGLPGSAPIVGSLDELTVEDDGRVWGMGWLMDLPEARKAGRMMQAGALSGNSVELAVAKYEIDVDWDSMEFLIDFVESKIAATTLVPVPAMEDCTIELVDPGYDFGEAALDEEALVASMSVGSLQPIPALTFTPISPIEVSDVNAEGGFECEVTVPAPPASWFTNDERFEEFSPIRIEEPDADGFREVWGFLFDWQTPHVGLAEVGVNFKAPHSRTDYAYFANGEVLCDDGTFVATGRLVLGCKHADESLDWRAAQDHYDDSGRAWAAVAIGENELGGYVHGYVLPGVSDEDIALARALGTSGDWRRIGGHLELIVGLSVNAEGYPKPRPRTYIANGAQLSLVGAGYVQADIERRVGLGQFLPQQAYQDLATVSAWANRQTMAEIEHELLADQRREAAEIEEALR